MVLLACVVHKEYLANLLFRQVEQSMYLCAFVETRGEIIIQFFWFSEPFQTRRQRNLWQNDVIWLFLAFNVSQMGFYFVSINRRIDWDLQTQACRWFVLVWNLQQTNSFIELCKWPMPIRDNIDSRTLWDSWHSILVCNLILKLFSKFASPMRSLFPCSSLLTWSMRKERNSCASCCW